MASKRAKLVVPFRVWGRQVDEEPVVVASTADIDAALQSACKLGTISVTDFDGNLRQDSTVFSEDTPLRVFSHQDLEQFLQDRGAENLEKWLKEPPAQSGRTPLQILLWLCSGIRVIPTTSGDPAFSALLASWPSWKKEHMFWAQLDLDIDQFLVRSTQLAGTCFMHAAAVVQHYLVVLHTGVPTHVRVDIPTFIQTNYRGEELNAYLRDQGGLALPFLERIAKQYLETESFDLNVREKSAPVLGNLIKEAFLSYGPGLVSAFWADPTFLKGASAVPGVFHTESVDTTSPDGAWHAMVLLGVREDPQLGLLFLLQNWWAGRDLIEVSLAYMARAKARVVFVATPLSQIPVAARVNAFHTVSACDQHATCDPRTY
eukprot:m.168404 g.168404  ORF g.168404 m.168404 type:complete len:374 (+) comp9909_c0_seq1:59-1180(+)